jgi:hypothetical protein
MDTGNNTNADPLKIENMIKNLAASLHLLKSKQISLTDILSNNFFYTSFSKILADFKVVKKVSGRYQYTGIEITKDLCERLSKQYYETFKFIIQEANKPFDFNSASNKKR